MEDGICKDNVIGRRRSRGVPKGGGRDMSNA